MSTSRLVGTAGGMAVVAWALGLLGADTEQLGLAVTAPQRLVDTGGADALLMAAATAAAWATWAWGTTGLLLTAASALPGALGRASGLLLGALLPAGARRTAAVLLGIGLSAAGPLTAGAAPVAPQIAVSAAVTEQDSAAMGTDGLPAVGEDAGPRPADWPVPPVPRPSAGVPAPGGGMASARTGREGASPEPPAGRPAAVGVPDWPLVPAGRHVVLRGECLWLIAADWLAQSGPTPTDAEIAAAVGSWWATNRAVIGDDPDLLLPGQVLTPPAPAAGGQVLAPP